MRELWNLPLEVQVGEMAEWHVAELETQLRKRLDRMNEVIAEGEEAIRFALGQWRSSQPEPALPALPILCDERHTIVGVYGLVSPREPQRVRYVGQSSCPATRYSTHCDPRAAAGRVAKWVESLHPSAPMMVLIEECAKAELEDRETYWIRRYRNEGMADLNTWVPRDDYAI